jgi:hypothetical protein
MEVVRSIDEVLSKIIVTPTTTPMRDFKRAAKRNIKLLDSSSLSDYNIKVHKQNIENDTLYISCFFSKKDAAADPSSHVQIYAAISTQKRKYFFRVIFSNSKGMSMFNSNSAPCIETDLLVIADLFFQKASEDAARFILTGECRIRSLYELTYQ